MAKANTRLVFDFSRSLSGGQVQPGSVDLPLLFGLFLFLTLHLVTDQGAGSYPSAPPMAAPRLGAQL
jgi:hypothetical protein